MSDLGFRTAPVPVRGDIAEAHQRIWERLARPGAWWTGRERVAIAEAVRGAGACGLCEKRSGALSPLAVQGVHDHAGVLPDAAVEAAHQIARDPGRLSRAWYEHVVAQGLGDAPYVELLGVVVAVLSIDAFCHGLGVPPHPLPDPVAGEPSRERPASAVMDGAWVPMVPRAAARGSLADLYPGGSAPNVLRAMSLVPDAVRDLHTLSQAYYLPIEQVVDPRARAGALDRAQTELLAARVSALSECFY